MSKIRASKSSAAEAKLAVLDAILTSILNRRTEVENYLLGACAGKFPLPDRQKCYELAMKLGDPKRAGDCPLKDAACPLDPASCNFKFECEQMKEDQEWFRDKYL